MAWFVEQLIIGFPDALSNLWGNILVVLKQPQLFFFVKVIKEQILPLFLPQFLLLPLLNH